MTDTDIIDRVSLVLNIPISDIFSDSKKEPICDARHLSIYFIKKNNDTKKIDIGKLFNRNHSTVISALKKVENMRNGYNPEFLSKYNIVNNELELK